MSSVKNTRDAGKRKSTKKSLLAPTLGVHSSDLGESRLNTQQIYALDVMFASHPAVQAAKTVLHSQLLSGGLQLVRNGKVLKPVQFGETDEGGSRRRGVTLDWAAHLEEHWLPFARDVIDAYLKWGICAVIFDELVSDEAHLEAVDEQRAELKLSNRKRNNAAVLKSTLLIPHVPHVGTYDVGFSNQGRYGYTRTYQLYSNAPGQATHADPAARIFVRQHPDGSGNVNSPMATVYEMGSFVSSITELAFTAEIARAQPSIVTQLRKADKQNDLSAGALFFDGDSRHVADMETGEDSSRAARDLGVQSQLMRMVNDLQTRAGTDGSASRQSFAPPDVPPKLFVLPKEQEMAPHVTIPQPRGDLEALMRLGIDEVCSAMGVPASLVFEGRYSNNNSTQLQLLNSTVAQLAKSVNLVLTKSYLTLYGDDGGSEDEPPQLRLQTAPLAATEEVQRLFASELIDIDTALPAALHALGATTDEVEAAMERAKAKEAVKCKCEEEDRTFQKLDRSLSLKERGVHNDFAKKKPAGAAGAGSSAAGAAGAAGEK